MARRISIVEGHPDADDARFGHALAEAHAQGAAEAGHAVRRARLATLDVPVLHRRGDCEHPEAPVRLRDSQEALAWAEHVVLLYPLWLGTMPALLKAWLEPTAAADARGRWPRCASTLPAATDIARPPVGAPAGGRGRFEFVYRTRRGGP